MAALVMAGPVIFEFGGGREMVYADRARALLELVAAVNDPTHIKLSNKSFSHEAAALVAERLANFKNVTIADISDIIAGVSRFSRWCLL
jgi:Ran GTPase-activating protein (RanGAP) involved in mRNA processing and transport